MKKTKIDWADSTWNPVTGCQHDCEYCYARSIAKRFGGYTHDEYKNPVGIEFSIGIEELNQPMFIGMPGNLRKAPYPFGFTPTLHRYRLDEPARWTKPRNIFVCSMADLFGDWVPLEWILDVFKACEAAPQHRYLFLTKNPARYLSLGKLGLLPERNNFWYGTTVTRPEEQYFFSLTHNCFLSIEPILEDFGDGGFIPRIGWVIIGAETGKRAGKVSPEKAWIKNLADVCRPYHPIFMKESLRGIMGDEFQQKFPWEVRKNG